MAQSSTFTYDQHVVVAEAEWQLNCSSHEKDTIFGTYLGGLKWQCTLHFTEAKHKLTLECMDLKKGSHKGQVHLEVFLYSRENDTKSYTLCTVGQVWSKNPERVLLTAEDAEFCYVPFDYVRGPNGGISYSYGTPRTIGERHDHILLTVRILKDREEFHDFTVEKPIGHLAANCQLKVGKTTFHVNKQWLASVSPYFHRLFNLEGAFVEKEQDVIETGETDANAYHDFLVAICPVGITALPNCQNLAKLFHLAHYYEVDLLREKLANSLKHCREMATEERLKLAAKYGVKELQATIALGDMNSLEDAMRICLGLINVG